VIHPNLIKRRADEDGLSASAVERDYVLAHALTAISRRAGQAGLVFKGGTALRLCHFDEYRYSADLDFSLLDGMKADDALELIANALVECQERAGFPILQLIDENQRRIEYVGPLGAKSRSLKIDLSDDELVEETTTLSIARRYEDQPQCRCLVYTLDEIAAEKLRCVMQRPQCRDLYDPHELLVVRGVDAETVWPAFGRKARHRGRDPGEFAERFDNLVPEWKRRWDRELVEYVDSPPHFEAALRAVRRQLRFAFR
jgi:predicted nucleotidyltransferase component of viral defense system